MFDLLQRSRKLIAKALVLIVLKRGIDNNIVLLHLRIQHGVDAMAHADANALWIWLDINEYKQILSLVLLQSE